MLVNKNNKGYLTRSDKPNENWLPSEEKNNYYVVEDGSILANKIICAYPYYNFINANDNLVDIEILEKPINEQPKTDMELLQERILQLEVAEVNRKSTEIEQQILGGTV